MRSYDELIAAQQPAREAFGRMLRIWRMRNGWTQYTVAEWSKAAGFTAISYGNLSVIEQGKAGELRQANFFMLQEQNRRLIEQDWGVIADQKLRELVQQGQPLLGDDGVVWDAVAFWRCYIGDLPVPAIYTVSALPPLSRKAAAELCEQWRRVFRSGVKELSTDPVAALQRVTDERLRSVLLGVEDYSPADLAGMRLGDGSYEAEALLRAALTPPP